MAYSCANFSVRCLDRLNRIAADIQKMSDDKWTSTDWRWCFRSLIVASFVCTILWISGFILGEMILITSASQDTEVGHAWATTLMTVEGEDYFEEETSHIAIFLGLMALFLLVIHVVSLIGMFFFLRWSRTLFLVLLAIGFLSSLFFFADLHLSWYLVDFFNSTCSFISGAIVTLAFASPVASEFK